MKITKDMFTDEVVEVISQIVRRGNKAEITIQNGKLLVIETSRKIKSTTPL